MTDKERINVLIIDDTLFNRARSRKVELLTRVHNHSDNKYYNGFRALTLGWSDGNTFLPVLFNLLNSKNKKTRVCEADNGIDKRSNGYKRRQNSIKTSTEAALELIKQAKNMKIPAEYVLFDSWFSSPKFIQDIVDLGYNTISMLKDMHRYFYLYKGKYMRLSNIYAYIDRKANIEVEGIHYIATVTVHIRARGDKLIPLKIAFVCERGNKRNWLAIATTNTSLTRKEIVRIYGKRWDIEVFFKTCKSYLKLDKEFQGHSYDMMVAQTTIVFSRYIMLACENRKNIDWRSVGDLFFFCCEELSDIKLSEAIRLIIDLIKQFLQGKLVLSEDAINEALSYFIDTLPAFFKDKLAICRCES